MMGEMKNSYVQTHTALLRNNKQDFAFFFIELRHPALVLRIVSLRLFKINNSQL
jgi:hypothetical protein